MLNSGTSFLSIFRTPRYARKRPQAPSSDMLGGSGGGGGWGWWTGLVDGGYDGEDGVPDRLRPVPCRTTPGRAERANIGAAARRSPPRLWVPESFPLAPDYGA